MGWKRRADGGGSSLTTGAMPHAAAAGEAYKGARFELFIGSKASLATTIFAETFDPINTPEPCRRLAINEDDVRPSTDWRGAVIARAAVGNTVAAAGG